MKISCEKDKKKNGLFSFKIVCENNLKRGHADCFSDTLEIQFFPEETPVPPDERGHPPPVLSPCLCLQHSGMWLWH